MVYIFPGDFGGHGTLRRFGKYTLFAKKSDTTIHCGTRPARKRERNNAGLFRGARKIGHPTAVSGRPIDRQARHRRVGSLIGSRNHHHDLIRNSHSFEIWTLGGAGAD